MTDITELAQRVCHWADMAALTSERVSCLSVEQLEEIANALRELQERRKADNEPLAFTEEHEISNMHATGLYLRAWPADRARNAVEGSTIPLYRHAQPAPVVPDDVLDALQKVARIRLDMNEFDGDRRGIADCLGDAEEALIEVVNRRAAMLQGAPACTCPSGDGSLRWPCPVHPGNSPVIPNGYVMVPKEPTKEMIDAGWLHFMGTKNPSSKGTYKAMLAAAPQEVPDGK